MKPDPPGATPTPAHPVVPVLLILLTLVVPALVAAQDPCPAASGRDAEAGWEAYRAGDMGEARRLFQMAVARCANDQYSRTGLGYVELREGDEIAADSLFRTVVRAEPDNVDALAGLGLVSWREADLDEVRRYLERVVEIVPDHPTALEYLERVRGRTGEPDESGADPDAGDPGSGEGASDEADRAWDEGDTDRAFELYRARLQAGSDDSRVLHRMALMHGWREEYERSLELFDRLLADAPTNLDVQVDRARVLAWQGNTGRALDALEAVLEVRPDHAGALEARALFQAWAGRYEESLGSYDELISIDPDQEGARRQQARVMAWASDFEGSRRVYEELLEEDPDDTDARLGLARSLAVADDLDAALAQYDRVLQRSPRHLGALQGKARTLAWDQRLVEAEALIGDALEVAPDESTSWTTLAQILRGQGRDAAAKEALERAVALSPTNGDAHDQLRAVSLALAPAARPSTRWESDSDGNRMLTTSVMASVHAVPRLELRVDAYRRAMELNALEATSFGGVLTGVWVGEPGWRFSAGIGGNVTDAAGNPSYAVYRAGMRSPARHPVQLRLDVSSQMLDETAALAVRGVRHANLAGSVRWTPAAEWRVDASMGWAHFDGSAENTRLGGSLSASRRIGRSFSLGAGLRTFGYDKDLNDGYFDPGYYGILEVTSWWRHTPGSWSLLLQGAPGIQQVTRDGDVNPTLRGSARIGYVIAPRRELALSWAYSSAGLLTSVVDATDYRYTALVLALDWVF